MKTSKVLVEYLSVVSLAGALIATRASAQQTQASTTTTTTTTAVPTAVNQTSAPAAAASDDDSDQATKLNAYVVTGSPTPITELNASFDVSLLAQADIVSTPKVGIAGLLDSVPGFYGESSGGEVGQNLSVSGIRNSGGFFDYISLQEDGLPVTYNGFYAEYSLRPDSTYQNVEVVRNGPSAVFAPEAGAAIVNWISRMPSIDSGDATVSVTSEGSKRIDFFYGGPINANGWSGSVGGYYENGQGERRVGYDMEKGGQIRASLIKTFPGGSVTINYKYINANTPYYVPAPVAESPNGTLSALPGFDPHFDTLYGPETEHGTLIPPTGYGDRASLDQIGAYDLTNQLTVKFEKDLGNGFKISNGLRLAHTFWIDSDDRANGNSNLYNAAAFVTASEPVLASYATSMGLGSVSSAELVQVSNGQVISNPAGLNGNGLLINSDQFQYHEDIRNIFDDLRLTWKTDSNTVSVGCLYMNNAIGDDGSVANSELIDVRNHAHLYDVQGVNASGAVVDHLTYNGVLAFDDAGNSPVPGFAGNGAAFYANGDEDLVSTNYYLDDDIQVTKQLHIDAGVRFEEITYYTNDEGWVFGAPLPIAASNPTVIAAQTAGVYGNGTYSSGSSSAGDYAWSVGANYQFNDHFSVFARETKDYDTGVQDFNVYGGQNGNPNSNSAFESLRYSQAGARFETPQVAISVTGFYALNDNTGESETGAVGGPPFTAFITFKVEGVDFETVWQPIHAFQVEVSGVLQHSTLEGIPGGVLSASGDKDGNQIDRLPDVQIRVKPEYKFAYGSAYILATYYGQRYGDLANTQKLGTYTDWGAGITINLSKAVTLDLEGDNLGNALAFTEGNPRGLGNLNAGTSPQVFARPIFGRNAKISCTLHF
jgi:iron complex outermembrane recepter protein